VKSVKQERTEAVCSNCGAAAKTSVGNYRFTETGLENVVLTGIELIRCPRCKNVDPVIRSMNRLMQVLAAGIAGKPCKLDGKEIRFLRKFLRMTGEEFAGVLGTDKTTISKWENEEQSPGERADRLIRAVTLILGDGLDEYTKKVVRQFPEIEEVIRDIEYNLSPESQTCEYA
jgi:putative zinc finger/helix-turn-helix YgiT family protein